MTADTLAVLADMIRAAERKSFPEALAELVQRYERRCSQGELVAALEAELVKVDQDDDAGPAPQTVTALTAMMRDPRYWHDRDPAFCSRVTEAFRSLVGVPA